MIKNKLYPLIEKYINEYLYGFNKEQLQLGLTNGIINLNKLNLRPDAINSKIDSKNIPIWIKAGLISKIEVGCSLMNFIGEKPIDVLIEDVDILLTPSYKWIIQNVKSFLQETEDRINDEYDMAYNNSHDIYTQKVNVIDSSIFKQKFLQEIFKDGSKVAKYINKIFLMCLKFYYSKNYAVNLTIKNLHIRFEDDQLINYIGDIAIGIKVSKINVILSSEGIMKRDCFKLEKLDVYWELQPKILISSELLTSSLQYNIDDENYSEGNLKLEESYYKKLNAINFSNFKYIPNTAFIIENFNCNGKIGTQADNNSIDIFSNQQKNFKVYFQFASSELNLNIFPELATIFNNLKKFSRSYIIIKEVESFKPMKKPMDKDNPIIKKMNDYFKQKNHNKQIEKNFRYKEKMYVRDWIYYFFWCKKCNSSMVGKNINPLRMEFCRFFNICYGLVEDPQKLNNSFDKKDKKDSVSVSINEYNKIKKDKPTNENPNPENINIGLTVQMLIKGFNIKLNSNYSKGLNDFISFKMNGGDIKIKLDQEKFDLNFNWKDFVVEPSKIIEGEKVIVSKKANFKKINLNYNNLEMNMNNSRLTNCASMNQLNLNNSFKNRNNNTENEIDKLLKKNSNFNEKMKLLNNALLHVEENDNLNEKAKDNKFNKKVTILKPNESHQSSKTVLRSKQNKPSIPMSSSKSIIRDSISKNNNIVSNILNNTIENSKNNKIQEEKNKKDYLLSQKIAEYNRNISQNSSINGPINKSNSNNKLRAGKKQNQNTNLNNKNVPLNPFEIKSNTGGHSISLHYIKSNKNMEIDSFDLMFGTIRLNLFLEYASSFFNVLSDYKSLLNKSSFNNNKQKSSFKIQRQLINMKKYIYNYLLKIPENKKDNQIKEYINFLKHENEISESILQKKGGFEINYILSMFSRGMNANIDYENFECVYYKKNEFNLKSSHQILGKFLIPNMNFNFQFNSSSIIIKLFDFEFELNDLENSKILLQTLNQIIKEKMAFITVCIQPCFVELKKKYEQILEDKEHVLTTEDNEINNIPNKAYQPNAFNDSKINMIHRNFNVLNNQINRHQIDELPEKIEEENYYKNKNTENSDIINIKI